MTVGEASRMFCRRKKITEASPCTVAVHELRQQTTALQNQLQQVQLDRSTLQSRLKTSQAEIDSLQQVRQWYQQQLALAQEARVRLQGEMANMQVRLDAQRRRICNQTTRLFVDTETTASPPLPSLPLGRLGR